MSNTHRIPHQLKLIRDQVVLGSMGTISLIATSIYLFGHQVENQDAMYLWAGAACLIACLITAYSLYSKRFNDVAQQRRVLYAFTALGFLTGVIWSFPPLLILDLNLAISDDLLLFLFIVISIIGMVTAALGSTTAYLPMYYCSVLPFLISLIWVCSIAPTTHFSLLSITALIIVYSLSLFSFAFVINRRQLEAIDLRRENLALAEQYRMEKERAESSNLAKSRFLAATSHDLRQPLYAMDLYSQALQDVTDPALLKRITSGIGKTTASLRAMLNTILDLSKIEAKAIDIQCQTLPVSDVFEAIDQHFTPIAAAKSIELRVVHSSLWLESGPVLLHRILSNLVSNAIKYTASGKVLIGVRRAQQSLLIQVWDTGVGLSENNITRVFQEYYQVDNTERDKDNGLGLGLAIVKGLSNSLGIKINCHSELGRGSCFTLALQRAKAGSIVGEVQRHSEDIKVSCAILLIDDDMDILSAGAIILRSWGADVRCAQNRAQADAVLAQGFEPKVIISDYRLREGMVGTRLLDALIVPRKERCLGIIITGETAVEVIEEIVASPYNLLHKPLDPVQIKEAIIGYL